MSLIALSAKGARGETWCDAMRGARRGGSRQQRGARRGGKRRSGTHLTKVPLSARAATALNDTIAQPGSFLHYDQGQGQGHGQGQGQGHGQRQSGSQSISQSVNEPISQ